MKNIQIDTSVENFIENNIIYTKRDNIYLENIGMYIYPKIRESLLDLYKEFKKDNRISKKNYYDLMINHGLNLIEKKKNNLSLDDYNKWLSMQESDFICKTEDIILCIPQLRIDTINKINNLEKDLYKKNNKTTIYNVAFYLACMDLKNKKDL